MPTESEAIALCRDWVQRFVVGLSLCPFAAAPLEAGRVRFVCSRAPSPEEVLAELLDELTLLEEPDGPETTLLILRTGLEDFDRFLDLHAAAEALLARTGFLGRYQLAPFHPDFVFNNAPPNDPADWTNRSPLPMLHILDSDGVARAVQSHPDAGAIPRLNARKLRSMGVEALRAILARNGHHPVDA